MPQRSDSRTRTLILAGAGFAAAAALAEAAMGRRLWCACGSAVPWSWDIASAHNSQHLVDPYTLTHVLHGILFYGALHLVAGGRLSVGARALAAVALESGWEVLENSSLVIERYRAATVSLGYYGDSIVNSMSDIAACLLGFALASRLSARASVAVVVLVELALLLWVRDNLTLNILMLVWPIEAVRRWQAG